MQRPVMNNTIRVIRRAAKMLMRMQTRAESSGSAYLDTGLLSEHMRRDLGLMDGQEPRLEPPRRMRPADPEETTALVRLYMTPHAS